MRILWSHRAQNVRQYSLRRPRLFEKKAHDSHWLQGWLWIGKDMKAEKHALFGETFFKNLKSNWVPCSGCPLSTSPDWNSTSSATRVHATKGNLYGSHHNPPLCKLVENIIKARTVKYKRTSLLAWSIQYISPSWAFRAFGKWLHQRFQRRQSSYRVRTGGHWEFLAQCMSPIQAPTRSVSV